MWSCRFLKNSKPLTDPCLVPTNNACLESPLPSPPQSWPSQPRLLQHGQSLAVALGMATGAGAGMSDSPGPGSSLCVSGGWVACVC